MRIILGEDLSMLHSLQNHIQIATLGLMSGFTIMISGSTLNFWLSVEELDIKTIGIFSLILIPYAINFLWAPVFDVIKPPILSKQFGQRVSWLIVLQISLSAIIYLLSLISPKENIWIFGLIASFISLFASAQDSVLGALRTEVVKPDEQGSVSGTYIFGYRLGMFLSGYVAIYFSEYIDFSTIYELFSLVILMFPVILIISYNKVDLQVTNDNSYQASNVLSGNGINNPEVILKQTIIQKLRIFNSINFLQNILNPVGSIYFILLAIIFLVTYRLPDNFIVTMINPFLLKLGYKATEIATVGKLFGLISAIIGGLIASYIMRCKDIIDSLVLFGSLHAAAHLLFLLQEFYGKNISILYLVIGFEGTTSGMSMAAYMGFIASLCHGKFRATQYAFFSSMMGFSRAILPSISGYFVFQFGWDIFFIFTSLAAIPPLFLAIYLKKLRN